MQQIWNHYEKQLNGLSLDYEQLKTKKNLIKKENKDIVSKGNLVDWIIYNNIVKL